MTLNPRHTAQSTTEPGSAGAAAAEARSTTTPKATDLSSDPEFIAILDKLEEQDKARKAKLAEEARLARVEELNRDVPQPGTTTGPIILTSAPLPAELPETVGELQEELKKSTSVVRSLAIIEKLSAMYGAPVTADTGVTGEEDFHPLIIEQGFGNNPDAVHSVAVYLVPLRRQLARFFDATTPDVKLMCDSLGLAYWQVLQSERLSISMAAACLSDPTLYRRAEALDRTKDRAIRRMVFLLETLRRATGRTLTMAPEVDFGRVLQFPGSQAWLASKKRASAG